MDLYDLMRKRRSVRNFSTEKFPKEKLQKILDAARLAPSGADLKPYTFFVIEEESLKIKIKNFCEKADKDYYYDSEKWFKDWINKKNILLDKQFLTDAPYLVVIAGENDKPYWLESTWIAIGYMILAAEYEGLNTLTYTPGKTEFLIKLLDIPKNYKPVAIIPIGFSK
jgi:nitroreductase